MAREKGYDVVIRKTAVTNTLDDNERHSFHLYFSTRSGKSQVMFLHN